jgi:nucleotide-binding universal stress UspA family protein
VKGPIICGVDEAGTAEGAVQVARELAQRCELPLVYVHVLAGDGRTDAPRRMLAEAAEHDGADIAIENGHPADRLVELARGLQATFLVVGNHGARAPLLGSISADVSRRAPCPVVVVPPTADLAGGILRFELGHALRTGDRA